MAGIFAATAANISSAVAQRDRTGRRIDIACPAQLRSCIRASPCASGDVEADQAAGRSVARHQHIAAAADGDIGFAQEAAVVGTHEQRGVGPPRGEGAVDAAAGDQQVGEAQRHRLIGAGPHLQPLRRSPCQHRRSRIDHHHPRAAPQAFLDFDIAREPGRRRIVAPKHDAVRVGEVGRADVEAVGEAAGIVLVPVADLGGVDRVGAAEGANEALDPRNAVRDVRAARRRHRERDLLGPVCVADRAHARSDLIESLVPADRLPSQDRPIPSAAFAASVATRGRDDRRDRAPRAPSGRAFRRSDALAAARSASTGRRRRQRHNRTASGTGCRRPASEPFPTWRASSRLRRHALAAADVPIEPGHQFERIARQPEQDVLVRPVLRARGVGVRDPDRRQRRGRR